jgi:hypothetical protein
MKKLLTAVLTVIVGGFVAVQAQESKWEPGTVLTIAGTGATGVDSSDTAVGATVGLSYEGLFNVPLELGVRQGFNYSDVDGSAFGGSTEAALDLNFYAWKRLAVFGGGATSIRYADGENTDWFGGPEAGVKFYFFDDVFFVGRVNYDLKINSRDSDTEDAWRYTLGLAVKF